MSNDLEEEEEGLTSVSPSRDDVGVALSTQKRPTTPSTQKAQTVTQRREINGAESKSKIPIEEEVDLRVEKVGLKS